MPAGRSESSCQDNYYSFSPGASRVDWVIYALILYNCPIRRGYYNAALLSRGYQKRQVSINSWKFGIKSAIAWIAITSQRFFDLWYRIPRKIPAMLINVIVYEIKNIKGKDVSIPSLPAPRKYRQGACTNPKSKLLTTIPPAGDLNNIASLVCNKARKKNSSTKPASTKSQLKIIGGAEINCIAEKEAFRKFFPPVLK